MRAVYGIDECQRICRRDNMSVEDVEFKTVTFLDKPLPSFSEISSLFPLHDDGFHIDLGEKIGK